MTVNRRAIRTDNRKERHRDDKLTRLAVACGAGHQSRVRAHWVFIVQLIWHGGGKAALSALKR